MNQLFHRVTALLLVLSLSLGTALAADGEAALRFRRVARLINARGLIAETEPITDEEIAAASALLEKEPERLYEVVNGFLSRMDTHSMYLSADDYGAGFSNLTGYPGIGVTVRQTESGFFVEQVAAHSPAANAGVQPGDRLTAADGAAVDGLTLDELSARLRGEAGSKLTLTVERGGQTLAFELTRAVVHQSEVGARELAAGVYYVEISGFTSSYTPADFAEAWQEIFAGDDDPRVILDLRDNGGGVVDYALAIADLVLEDGDEMCTMRVREDQGGALTYYAEGAGMPPEELVVLVNGNTASAAELLAGILHEAGGATLLGETTYGKGQGQYHLDLSGGDVLVLTALAMELPESGCWEGEGLAPDMAVALDETAADRLAGLSTLDTTGPIRFGAQGANVAAMTERLSMLGYLAAPTDTFTTPVLSALRAFEQDQGLDTAIDAWPWTLRALDRTARAAAEQGLYVDTQLSAALALLS